MAEREHQTSSADEPRSSNRSAFDPLAGLGFEGAAGAHGHWDPAAPGGEAEEAAGLRCLELCPICRAADVARASAPPELREQWHSVQREALLTMRALIDQYLERLGAQPSGGARVEDIPIE